MSTVTKEAEKLNRIGLDIEKSEELAKHLNELLANYSVFIKMYAATTGIFRVISSLNYTKSSRNYITIYSKKSMKSPNVC